MSQAWNPVYVFEINVGSHHQAREGAHISDILPQFVSNFYILWIVTLVLFPHIDSLNSRVTISSVYAYAHVLYIIY